MTRVSSFVFRRLFFSFLSLTSLVCGCAPTSPFSETSEINSEDIQKIVRIGTYNIENFWDDNQTNTDETYAEYSSETSNWYAEGLISKKARNIAHAIALAGSPDVLGLQEIESGKNTSRTLELLKPNLEKQGYRYFALGQQQNTSPTSVTTAVISKYPILSNGSVVVEGDSSARDPQVVEIAVQSVKLRLYVNHWKSQRKTYAAEDTELKRIETAKLVAADISNVRASAPNIDIIVLGDFNSQYNEAQIEQRETGINTYLLSTGDERLMLQRQHVPQLYNLWFERPVEKRCSYSYKQKLQCIDGILVTDTLFDNSGLRLVPRSLEVIGRDGGQAQRQLLNANGAPFRWQVRMEFPEGKPYFRHQGVGYSDHLPLVASFYVQTLKQNPQKVVYESPSTTPDGPVVTIPEKVPSCENEEHKDFLTTESNDPNNLLSCFVLATQNQQNVFKLEKTADSMTYVYVNRAQVGVTLSHSTDQNEQKVLKESVGKSFTQLKGRLGWNRGLRTLFLDNLNSVTFLPPN